MDLIRITRKQGLAFGIRARAHEIVCDLPPEEGGADAGLSPAELLAGSLGACIAIMVQNHCIRNGWDGDVEVDLTTELVDEPKRVARLVVDLGLPSGVPSDAIVAVRRVADQGVIRQTLKVGTAVDIEIV